MCRELIGVIGRQADRHWSLAKNALIGVAV
jgi:hypothetical protein